MTVDRIEREILIEAPLAKVWGLVTQPGWWVDQGSLAGVPADAGTELVARHGTEGEFPLRVERVEPMTYISYRWASAFPGRPLTGDNSTLIEFTLTADGDKTTLRVAESGFAALALSAQEREKAHDGNTKGWREELDKLRERAER